MNKQWEADLGKAKSKADAATTKNELLDVKSQYLGSDGLNAFALLGCHFKRGGGCVVLGANLIGGI